MNHGPVLFFGLLLSMALGWLGLVFGSFQQLGSQKPAVSDITGQPYPTPAPGQARQGMEVYRANGCASCHTQQIQPKETGTDIARGWGKRRSVARDYIYGEQIQLGRVRIGPDLANVGARKPESFAANWKSEIPQ